MDLNNKRLLITCGGGLGDMIVYTPALRRLKEKYPQCRLTFMTKYGNHEVLEGLPYIDKVIYIRRGKFLGRYRVLPDFYRQDIVIFTDWQPQLLLFSKLFGIPIRAGVPRLGHKLNKYLTKHLQTSVFKTAQYAGRTDADLLEEAVDITLDGDMTHLDISMPGQSTSNEVDKMLDEINVNGDYLLLSPFTGLEERNWPVDTAQMFVQKVEQDYSLPVIVIGQANKRNEADKISKYNLSGRTNTMQLIELIRRAKCLITPDSGPMHVAGAMGTKCIALFSKDLPSRWAPKENCVPVYLGMPCSPCSDETARKCHDVGCMRNISAQQVIKELKHIL